MLSEQVKRGLERPEWQIVGVVLIVHSFWRIQDDHAAVLRQKE